MPAILKLVLIDLDTQNFLIVAAGVLLWAVCLYLLNHTCECGQCVHCKNAREERRRRDH